MVRGFNININTIIIISLLLLLKDIRTIDNLWCNAIYLIPKQINSDDSTFNLFGLLANSTERVLVATVGRKSVTSRAQNLPLRHYTTHVDRSIFSVYRFYLLPNAVLLAP